MPLHPALRRFVDQMQARLDEQIPTKGDLGWRGPDSMGLAELSHRVDTHKQQALMRLGMIVRTKRALTKEERDEIVHDLSDAANYIMMIADKVVAGEVSFA